LEIFIVDVWLKAKSRISTYCVMFIGHGSQWQGLGDFVEVVLYVILTDDHSFTLVDFLSASA